MSVIKSLDEWWEARENKRLECFDDGEWREDRTALERLEEQE